VEWAMEQDNDVWQEQKPKRHKGKHDKPKPWDEDPNIDRWKIEKFDPSWNESGLVAESSFSTLFPVYIGPLKPQKCPFNFLSLSFFLLGLYCSFSDWFFDCFVQKSTCKIIGKK
jgi:hypothetical protein